MNEDAPDIPSVAVPTAKMAGDADDVPKMHRIKITDVTTGETRSQLVMRARNGRFMLTGALPDDPHRIEVFDEAEQLVHALLKLILNRSLSHWLTYCSKHKQFHDVIEHEKQTGRPFKKGFRKGHVSKERSKFIATYMRLFDSFERGIQSELDAIADKGWPVKAPPTFPWAQVENVRNPMPEIMAAAQAKRREALGSLKGPTTDPTTNKTEEPTTDAP